MLACIMRLEKPSLANHVAAAAAIRFMQVFVLKRQKNDYSSPKRGGCSVRTCMIINHFAFAAIGRLIAVLVVVSGSNGHVYDSGNVSIKRDGSRRCLTCHRKNERATTLRVR